MDSNLTRARASNEANRERADQRRRETTSRIRFSSLRVILKRYIKEEDQVPLSLAKNSGYSSPVFPRSSRPGCKEPDPSWLSPRNPVTATTYLLPWEQPVARPSLRAVCDVLCSHIAAVCGCGRLMLEEKEEGGGAAQCSMGGK